MYDIDATGDGDVSFVFEVLVHRSEWVSLGELPHERSLQVVDAYGAYFRQVGDLDAVVQLAGLVLTECIVRIRYDADFIEDRRQDSVLHRN